MAKEFRPRFYYLASLEFLGFRYHGWQKQGSGIKTVQQMLEKTLTFILENDFCKTLGSSRTDAMVSAKDFYCKITLYQDCEPQELLKKINDNLPQDIYMKTLERSEESFEIINNKVKTYHYNFCYQTRMPPFSAALYTYFNENLDFELMQKACEIFKGDHRFSKYCYRPNENKNFDRTIIDCSLEPKKGDGISSPLDYLCFSVTSNGFMRNQIRIMVGALIEVGSQRMSLQQLEESLKGEDYNRVAFIAPASGLTLYKTLLSRD